MSSRLPEMFLGEYMSRESLGPLVHKRFLKEGRWVRFLPFLYAEYWVFVKGVVLGWSRRHRLEVLVRAFALPGKEREVMEHLEDVAKGMMSAHGGEPTSLEDMWFRTVLELEAGLDAIAFDTPVRRALQKREMRLGQAMDRVNKCVVHGIGFGATYPEQTERIWRRTFETAPPGPVLDAARPKIRGRGLFAGGALDRHWGRLEDLPSEPRLLQLDEMERVVLEDFAAYVAEFFPGLMEPLELSPYLGRATT